MTAIESPHANLRLWALLSTLLILALFFADQSIDATPASESGEGKARSCRIHIEQDWRGVWVMSRHVDGMVEAECDLYMPGPQPQCHHVHCPILEHIDPKENP